MITAILFVSVFFAFILLRRRKKWSPTNSPPHPKLHPIFGHIPTLKRLDPIIQFALHTIESQVGKIFRLKLGPKWNLVLTDYEKIKVQSSTFLIRSCRSRTGTVRAEKALVVSPSQKRPVSRIATPSNSTTTPVVVSTR